MRFSPGDLARRLEQPEPTPEQSAAISAPFGPGMIIAGAGSGKTETMAARVVWLVANDLVRPDQVLGLTFTRKAARELAARIRRRLAQLAARGVIDPDAGLLDGEPTVSTYDAYAGRIVSEHALRLGREPGARLITEAEAWQFAQRAVATYDGPMDDVEYAPSTVVGKVLALHAELSGHLVDAEQVRSFTRELREQVAARPRAEGQRTRADIYADVAKALAVQDARAAMLPIVEAFRERKRLAEVVDFADQAALAATLAGTFPEVADTERGTYRVVLLDEYQDTSHTQLVLLRALFGGGHPVTAVGDPCQSIYGWRGASAGTLASFREHFRDESGAPPRIDSLTVSFRNGQRILTVANQLAAPLRARGLDVPELSAFGGSPGRDVTACLHLTADDEAMDVARRARAFWDASSPGRTVAVLVRTRSQIPRLDAALRAVELPVEVVGVGGLLTTPEVSDIVATLRVIADPGRGDALMRLLTGSRWRIGARDLDALARWARRRGAPVSERGLAAAHGAGALLETGDGSEPGNENDAEMVVSDEIDELSIVDALDALPGPEWFSEAGYQRLSALAAELRGLRQRAGQSLTELVHDVERTLGLDVEVAAREGPIGRANLDRFLDVTAEFEGTGQATGLSAFLAYLDAAETAERGLEPGEVEVSGDRVQVLTVHGAKGLEWDAVFVTGLVEGVFPSSTEKAKAWLGDPGELPYPLRGDAGALPSYDVAGAANQKEVKEALERFFHDAGEAARLEERRLAYVAVTRARELLVCSGYRWDDTTRPREPSPFLLEIWNACRTGSGEIGPWVEDAGTTHPLAENEQTWQWPYDPLGVRRPALESGAQLVREAAKGAMDLETAAAMAEWDDDVERLLAERERQRRTGAVQVELPQQLSVSQLVQLRHDPEELARTLRRPVPRAPAPLARRGTLFHAWLETRWGAPRLLDIEEMPGSFDEGSAPDQEISALQEAFLASDWAQRTPIEVEAPFELFVAGVLLRGRVDAVFGDGAGGIEVVDWKTGSPPRDADDESAKAVQLAAYRLAFARLRGLPLERVGAAFHYVRENLTLRPVDLLDELALETLVREVPVAEEPS
ncbi:ATP-dependent helicase [Actinobacteria bacterium YIM 96077]|uniref:DNA 3'-5' helicase n=1 Tax=Phytoactinopolyspora halophila TaxID=1981511 RepID=A0A329R2E4_9ACTN|nr:ATP-dependent DNA helicase [Phytoactinopolyspora halophila]AYY11951.1 ATP-dependent helicase [Actinobacteria bacterium YIM 96077]RAW18815.1 ATP-dependent helicase [Phytoactinopolyspora halophila]